MLRITASFISWVTHPLLTVTYLLILLFFINPFDFGFSKWSDQGAVILFIRIFMTTFCIPAFAIFILSKIGLAKSMELPEKEDRIAPYIITGIFYLWMFRNLLDNPDIPADFSRGLLGATIGLFMAFFINIFDKISAHTIGMGGLLGFVFIFLVKSENSTLLIQGFNHSFYLLPVSSLFLIICFIAGLTGISRLYLNAHLPHQVYAGYFIGILTQILALRFIP